MSISLAETKNIRILLPLPTMNSKFLLCVLALVMCSIVHETSAQYYGYAAASSYYPSYYGGYGLGAYGGAYGAYGYGSAYGGYYGKRAAGFGTQHEN